MRKGIPTIKSMPEPMPVLGMLNSLAMKINRFLLALALCFVMTFSFPKSLFAVDDVQKSVVKLLVTRRFPNMLRPWMKTTAPEFTASGVVIEDNRILTSARVVSYASQIYIQPFQSADKFSAKVEFVAPGINLAVLNLEDNSFFETYPALPFEKELPRVKDTVNVYGYPLGGKAQSITEGIISRIGYVNLRTDVMGLRIQVDAALNPGNNGGPAVIGSRIVGLAYGIRPDSSQGSDRGPNRRPGTENIGYLTPVEEIQMFLQDISDGKYDGKPIIQGIFSQTCENTAFREWLGLKDETTGILISRIQIDDPKFPLREGDLITHVGEYAVDGEGQVRVRDDLRLPASYPVAHIVKNGTVAITVNRKGEPLTVQVPVSTQSERLIQDLNDDYPRYFIYGPMVFTPVTMQFVTLFSRSPQRASLMGSSVYSRSDALRVFDGEELVALAPPLLSHAITKGYDPMTAAGIISHVNGIAVKNLNHLVEILRDSKDKYITFKLDNSSQRQIVFRRKDLASSTEQILDDNSIRYQYSDDLKSVWEVP